MVAGLPKKARPEGSFENSKGTQEVEDVLLLRRSQSEEVVDNSVGFRAAEVDDGRRRVNYPVNGKVLRRGGVDAIGGRAGMQPDSLEQIGGASIVQEEEPLAHAP